MLKLKNIFQAQRLFSGKKLTCIDVSEEVSSALGSKKPVVCLESTIITHGMPNPYNYKTTLDVQKIVRDQGAVPAVIGVMDGRIKVGLTDKQIEILSDPSTKAVKTSRRDFPYVLSQRLNGGTTVSGTLMVAGAMGINFFVTGGIGGVHRHGENTMDISADLIELGRHPIMTISSGAKSILDIEKTLEYLETQGVCVVSYGQSKNFPAFYSRESGQMAPYNVETPSDAAKLLHSCHLASMNSGILLAIPIPVQFSMDLTEMEAVIELALDEADKNNIHGKEVTPFILEKVSQITAGKSLESNIALIKNNALIGSRVAVEYCKNISR